MRVYLDDERVTPPEYDTRVYTAEHAISLLKLGCVTHISLDHDLGDDSKGTGYTVAAFIEQGAFDGTLLPIQVSLHTANPVGRKRMEQCIQNAMRYWERNLP